MCLSWNNWFWQFLLWEGALVLKELILTVSTLGGCGGLERTDFEHFLLWKGALVLKKLILNSFYFGRCGGLEKMILNSFYFGRVCLSWNNWFWTVSTLGGCTGLERTDFGQFLLWGGCGCLERTDFEHFLLWEGGLVLKELILDIFYLWEGVVVLKEHMGDAQGSIGDIQGGVWTYGHVGASGDIRSVWMHGASKHMGCQLNAPKCRTYMALKKIRVFEHMGV